MTTLGRVALGFVARTCFRDACSLVIPNEVEEWSERGERHRRLRREGSGERVGRRTSQSLDVNDATFSNPH
jgi:hypothetical protein